MWLIEKSRLPAAETKALNLALAVLSIINNDDLNEQARLKARSDLK